MYKPKPKVDIAAVITDIEKHKDWFDMTFWHHCIAGAVVRTLGLKTNRSLIAPEQEYDGENVGGLSIFAVANKAMGYKHEMCPLFMQDEWPQKYQDMANQENAKWPECCPQTAIQLLKDTYKVA